MLSREEKPDVFVCIKNAIVNFILVSFFFLKKEGDNIDDKCQIANELNEILNLIDNKKIVFNVKKKQRKYK